MVVFGHIAYLVLALVSAWLPYLSIILVARFLLGFLHIIICFTVYVHSEFKTLWQVMPSKTTMTSLNNEMINRSITIYLCILACL